MRSPRPLAEIVYWLLPFALAGVQATWIANSREILRFEEVAEGVRNVYWLDHGALYDGISTNVGWYGLLLVAYRLFGFSLFTAKWVRLALHVGALLCLAWVLRRGLRPGTGSGPLRAAVPLLAVGLSPSILFFNTLQTSFGTDLLYLPYLLALLAVLPVAGGGLRRLADGAARAAFGALAMVAWMSYPVFVFYLPALAWAYAARPAAGEAGELRRRLPGLAARTVAPALAGFLLPLAGAVAWLDRPLRLFHDPGTGSGLFRGGGTGFDLDPAGVAWNAARVLRDLFLRGTSYYFWVDAPELAGPLGLLGFGAVAAGSVWLWRRRPGLRTWIALAWLLPAVNLAVVSAGEGPQGLRRATSLLAGFYLAYVLVWREATRPDPGGPPGPWRRRLRGALVAGLVLVPVHHAVAGAVQYPRLPRAGEEQAHLWLRVRPSAEESLRFWLHRTAAGEPLDCRDLDLGPERCQYGGIFALVAGYRLWNGLDPVPLRGYDHRSGGWIDLSTARLSGEFSRSSP
ncbi:MAG TPA: hypothetical protein VLF66_12630 [Thermoanaerobaculia bacterium]|nr:hypothetical protein [Thermoanaerobaculia bacterium]